MHFGCTIQVLSIVKINKRRKKLYFSCARRTRQSHYIRNAVWKCKCEQTYYLTRGNGKQKPYSSTFCYHRKTSVWMLYKLIGNFPLTLILNLSKKKTHPNEIQKKNKNRETESNWLLVPVLHINSYYVFSHTIWHYSLLFTILCRFRN